MSYAFITVACCRATELFQNEYAITDSHIIKLSGLRIMHGIKGISIFQN